MNWRIVRLLLANELKMLVRDRRTVVVSIVLPVFIMPLMLLGTRFVQERRADSLRRVTYKYSIAGAEAKKARALVEKAREIASQLPEEGDGDRKSDLADFKFEEVRTDDPEGDLKAKKIHFYLEALSGEEADALAQEEARKQQAEEQEGERPDPLRPVRVAGVPLIRIHFQGDRDESNAGRGRVQRLLAGVRRVRSEEILRGRGFPAEPKQIVEVESRSLATPGQVSGSFVGRFLTFFLFMLMLSGGSVVAMDSIAGEKERGSLETLLTTAARRAEIVAAKQLSILAVALGITFIQVANILVYLTFKVIELPKDFVIEIPPAAVLTLLLLYTPVAVLVASVLLMVSAYAKTYKEAQFYFFPVNLVCLVFALASVLPGVSLRSAIAVVPLANVSVAVREVMVGKYDWPMIALTFLVMALTSFGIARASTRMLSKERLITASESDVADLEGGPSLFSKHVLRWYALLWAVMFAVAANIPQLATFRRQLLFNEIVIFLGAPALMIWKYRLNVRDALALRGVNPMAWIGVLLSIPSGHLVGIGVFRLANIFVPVSERVLEQFSRSILPGDVPLWQLFFFLSVLPAVCEEIGFRGTLLYGLRRKFRPAALALVVGTVFGLFHVALFRIIPTGFLGVILTAIALLTGSIFPGMVVHAGNNAFGMWAGLQEFPLGRLDWWIYVAAGIVFALSFYIVYRNRTPYPGLRAPRR